MQHTNKSHMAGAEVATPGNAMAIRVDWGAELDGGPLLYVDTESGHFNVVPYRVLLCCGLGSNCGALVCICSGLGI